MNGLLFTLMDYLKHQRPLVEHPNSLLVLSIILITGIIFSWLSKKIKIPVEIGLIFGGIVIGKYFLNIFSVEYFDAIHPITNFAIGLFGLIIGSHLDLNRLRNAGKRIVMITVTDIVVVGGSVFLAMHFLVRQPIEISIICAVIASATSPESIIHEVRKERAKGLLTKTILSGIALNNVIVITIFYFAYNYILSHLNQETDILHQLLKPMAMILESVLIGGVTGWLLIKLNKRKIKPSSFTGMVLVAILITVGISETFHFSSILSTLILGMILTNKSRYKNEMFNAFSEVEKEIFYIFFVIAGVHLDIEIFKITGLIGAVLILVRLIAKYVGARLGAQLAGAPQTVKKHIGFALYPMAALSLGLVTLTKNDSSFSQYASLINSIILTAIIFFDFLGPICTTWVLKKAGEINKDRLRLLDFLQEEFIIVNMKSKDKWESLDELTEFLYKTHRCRSISLKKLKEVVRAREKDMSTGIGNNIAIPHAIIEGGPRIQGVIGVSKEGIEFESLDGKPVNIIILIATPKEHYKYHLKALATISRIFGHNQQIKNQIIEANSAEEIFEIFQKEEVDQMNPFFEEM